MTPATGDAWTGFQSPAPGLDRAVKPGPDLPPESWFRLKPATRAAICDAARELLAVDAGITFRDLGELSFHLWESLRVDRALELELSPHTPSRLLGQVLAKLLEAEHLEAAEGRNAA